jgi:phosphatidate cytidylyltransferase
LTSELARRVAFGVVAAPIAIAIVLYGGAPLAALLAITAALGAGEFYRMARATGLTPLDNTGIVIAGLVPLVVHARYLNLYQPDASIGVASLLSIVMLIVIALAIWLRGVAGKPMGAVSATAFGAAYTGGTLSFAYAIRYHEYAFAPAAVTLGGWTFSVGSGALLLLVPLLATWASDTGAYAVGRTMGRHKLIPSVSPAKTIEGSVGGVLASVLVCWALAHWLLRPATHLDFRWRPFGVILFGVLASAAAQIGDLAESLFKRDAGVKDSSTLIPGHGGVLDRVDSLLFVFPVSYVLFGWLLTWSPS